MSPAQPLPASASTARGILMMLVGVLMFTAMDAVVKLLVGGYPAIQVVWARFTGQFVLVALLLAARPDLRGALRTRFPGLHVARSVFQFGTAGFTSSVSPMSDWPRRRRWPTSARS